MSSSTASYVLLLLQVMAAGPLCRIRSRREARKWNLVLPLSSERGGIVVPRFPALSFPRLYDVLGFSAQLFCNGNTCRFLKLVFLLFQIA